MGDYLFKLILTLVSVSAFAILDRAKNTVVFLSSVGGVLTYTAEYILLQKSENIFLVYFLSAGVTCIYSEIMARVSKTPVTVIMLPGIIPLVPGSLIYYSMRGLLENNYEMYSSCLIEVLLSAGGIATAAALGGALAALYKKTVNYWLLKLKETDE